MIHFNFKLAQSFLLTLELFFIIVAFKRKRIIDVIQMWIILECDKSATARSLFAGSLGFLDRFRQNTRVDLAWIDVGRIRQPRARGIARHTWRTCVCIIARHIRRTHPGIRLVASFNKPLCDLGPTTTPEAETAYYLRLLDLYDEVVVRCEYALDDGRIGLLPRDLRDRIEIIVNQICVPGCTRGPEHMRALQDWNEGRVPGQIQGCFHNGVSHTTARLSQNVLLSNRRVEELAGMGVCKMKIGGRNAPVERFIDYLATYIFEPTGAILAIKDVLAREFGTRRRSDPTFAQYSLP